MSRRDSIEILESQTYSWVFTCPAEKWWLHMFLQEGFPRTPAFYTSRHQLNCLRDCCSRARIVRRCLGWSAAKCDTLASKLDLIYKMHVLCNLLLIVSVCVKTQMFPDVNDKHETTNCEQTVSNKQKTSQTLQRQVINNEKARSARQSPRCLVNMEF